MSEAAFKLVYDGDAVRFGEMDVADLAPALLAMGQLLRSAGRLVYGEEAATRVRVKTMRDGSFEVWLNLGVHSVSSAWHAYSHSSEAQAAATLLGAIGITAKDGALAVIRFLRGKHPRRIDPKAPGIVEIEGADGTVIEVPDIAMRLALDPAIRSALEKIISDPLSQEGIDTVILGDNSTAQKIEKSEASYFSALSDVDDSEFVARQTKMFSITTLSFKPGSKWRLNDGHGNKAVVVSDEEFIGRIERSEEAFSKGDLLVCEVVERSFRTQTGAFKSEYEIVKVLEHRPAVRQDRFSGI